MLQAKLYTPYDKLSTIQANEVTDFLHAHLDEYGDEKKDIKKAIAYAMKEIPSPGGFVLTSWNEKQITGAVVVNKTGMEGYFPENLLAFFAVHKEFRGKGLEKQLIQHAFKICNGDIVLHVKPDNPANSLYEKLGFESGYHQMRYKKQNP